MPMESKYKVGQVVVIDEDLESFGENEHRHLTNVMKEAYSDLAIILDAKPAKGLTNFKDDGFNYTLKILRDRWYKQECESEFWTSDLFEECATPIFKINDLVHYFINKSFVYRRMYVSYKGITLKQTLL